MKVFIIILILISVVGCVKVNMEPERKPFFDGPTTGMRGEDTINSNLDYEDF